MAHVAIFTLWAWECPLCLSWVKHWEQGGADYHAFKHVADVHHGLPYKERPEVESRRTTWVFNVLSGDGEGQQAIVDSLDHDTGTRVL